MADVLVADADSATRFALRTALAQAGHSVRPRAIDSHVKRLRAKRGPAADLVETVEGVGYRLARGRGR